MSLAHTYPSLSARIREVQAKPFATIPTDGSWTRPAPVVSYAERYRGTEYETPMLRIGRAPDPLISTGRRFVLVTGTAAVLTVAFGLASALS